MFEDDFEIEQDDQFIEADFCEDMDEPFVIAPRQKESGESILFIQRDEGQNQDLNCGSAP